MMPSIDIVYVCLNVSFKGGDYQTRLVEQLVNQTLCLSSTIKCVLKHIELNKVSLEKNVFVVTTKSPCTTAE